MSTQVQFAYDNFTCNVRLSSNNINSGVVRNSYQMHQVSLSFNPIITDSLQNVNSTVTVILANCIRKPNSRTFWQRFEDFQGPCVFLKASKALKIWKN